MNGNAYDVLLKVCCNPFANVRELAGILGRPERHTGRLLDKLRGRSLVGRAWHTSVHLNGSYRYHAEPAGIEAVARELGMSASILVRTIPASHEWLRWTASRLDSVASIYAVASTLARASAEVHDDDSKREGAVTLTLYNSGSYDAIVGLHGGRTVGVIRQGLARSRSSLNSDRLWPISDQGARRNRRPLFRPGKILLLTPTEWEARVAYAYLSGGWKGPRMFVSSENPLVLLDPEYAANEIVSDILPSRTRPPDATRRYATATVPTRRQLIRLSQSAAFALTRKEKIALDVIADFTMIRHGDLSVFLEVRKARMSEIMTALVHQHGLVAKSGARGSTRYALSDKGIRYIGGRDRISMESAHDRWSLEIETERAVRVTKRGKSGRTYRGTVPNRSLTHSQHTDGIHWLVSRLKHGAGAMLPHMRFKWFLPTHRSRRQWAKTAIEPDALVELTYSSPESWLVRIPLMVEYERQAVHPGRSRRRLGRYIKYFGDGQSSVDNGCEPLVLFVFDNEPAELQFTMAAAEIGADLPMYTSNLERLFHVTPGDFLIANAWCEYPQSVVTAVRFTLVGRIHVLRNKLSQ